MSKATELRVIARSFSGDARQTMHHRSGDGEGDGAELWDSLASVPSAEEEMIAAEDAAERREGQKRGIKLLRVYLRQVFDERERELIRAILEARDGQTVRESAAGIGLDITEGVRVRRSILHKWDRTGKRLLAELRSFGFGAWRYLDFLSALKQAEEISQKYYTDLEGNRAKRRAYYAANKEKARFYYAANKEKARFYYAAHREEILAKLRSEWTEHIEENRAKSRAAWRRRVEKNREEILRKQAERRRKNREAVNARQREYYRTHKSQEYARIRAYQQAHPEKVRKWSRESRKRSRTARAAKKQEASKKDR